MNPYIGHDTQLYGVEEHRLVGGKGDGMRLFEVNNGKGLMLTISPDRCGDITRLRFKGINHTVVKDETIFGRKLHKLLYRIRHLDFDSQVVVIQTVETLVDGLYRCRK